MATISTTLRMFDAFSRPLQFVSRQINAVNTAMHQFNSSSNRYTLHASSINGMNRQLTLTRQQINSITTAQQSVTSATNVTTTAQQQMANAINNSTNSQQQFNHSVQTGTTAMGKLSMAIVTINQALELLKKLWSTISGFMTFADDITSVNNRLALVNDGLRSQIKLQKQVLDIANKTQTSYQSTADTVSKIGMFTQGLFKNNDEMLSFTAALNKSLTVGGANQVNKDAALLQLNQALASGRLQGDEFRSISENAPMFMNVLTRHLEIGRGELRKLSSEGKITAETIVSAFKTQSEYIDSQFMKLPMTFSGATTIIKNKFAEFIGFLNSAEGPLTKLTSQLQTFIVWLDSDKGKQFFNGLYLGIAIIVNVLVFLTNIIGNVVSALQDYWLPIATFVFIATIGFVVALIGALWSAIPPLAAIALKFLAIYWPVLLIAAAIAIVIAILLKMGVTSEQIIGSIIGFFYAFGSHIYNVVANIWNVFATFAEFLINLFIDPTYAIKKLFYDMVKTSIDNVASLAGSFDNAANILGNVFVQGANIAIGGVNALIRALNKIPGVDIGEISKFSAETGINLSQRMINFANNLEAPTSKKNIVSLSRMELKSIPDAFQSGFKKGQGMIDTISNFGKDLGIAGDNFGKTNDIPDIGKVGKVGKIEDTVDISNEDLKLMRELAEMKSIQNFVTLTPTVSVQTGDVRSEADIDTIVRKIEEKLMDEIASGAEGVYS